MYSKVSSAKVAKGILKPFYVRYRLALILLFTLMVAYIDRVNVSVLVVDPVFLTDMGISTDPVAKGMLMTVFLICYGGGMIILSPVGDWHGPRKAMLIAVSFWAIAMIWGGFAAGFISILLSRALLGLGEALHYPMQNSFVKNWFPAHERGKANAVWLIGVNVAPMIAMPLFTWLVPVYGWRFSFFMLAVIGTVPLFLLYKYTADHPHLYKKITKEEQNYIEAALQVEKDRETKQEKSSAWELILMVIKDYRVWMLVVAYTGISSIYWGTLSWLPSYLKEARGFSWATMGYLSSLPFILAIVVKLIAGHCADKMGYPARFMVVGLFGSAVFIFLGAYAQNNYLAAVLISCGVGTLAMATPCSWSVLQQIVPSKAAGTSAGIMSGVAHAISALSPVLVGFLINLTHSYVGGLMYMVGWGFFGAVASLVLVLKKY